MAVVCILVAVQLNKGDCPMAKKSDKRLKVKRTIRLFPAENELLARQAEEIGLNVSRLIAFWSSQHEITGKMLRDKKSEDK